MTISKRTARLSAVGAVTALALVATAVPASGHGDEESMQRIEEARAEFLAAGAPVPLVMSDNVEFLANIPDTTAISGDFSLSTEHFYVSSLDTLTVYDISNPELPVVAGVLPNFVFENEAMNYGEQGRGKELKQFIMVGADLFDVGLPSPSQPDHVYVDQPALQIVDVTNPALPQTAASIPATTSTHTVTCMRKTQCDYAYSAGSNGRFSIFDLRNLDKPKEIDANPNRPGTQGFRSPALAGTPEFSGGAGHKWNHVGAGIAYHTGSGGTAAFDVSRPRHPRLLTSTNDVAGTPEKSTPWNNFIHHNSWQPHVFRYQANKPASLKNGNVLLVTEEDYVQTDCEKAGSFQTWKVDNLRRRNAIKPLDKVELADLGGPGEGVTPQDGFCSAHWFDYHQTGIVATAYYRGGVRLLDVRDPRNIKSFGYVAGTGETWDSYWVPQRDDQKRALVKKTNIVYSVDAVRGLDVYKVTNMPKMPAYK
jgi:hypothetical protein